MDLIDIQPMRLGWGRIWQGGELSSLFGRMPDPYALFSMVGGMGHSPQVSVYMDDTDEEILPDDLILSLVQTAGSFLVRGRNLLIHCFEGKYRSTYLDVAIHMAYMKVPMEQAFGHIKTAHSIADLRVGTSQQLKRLELALKEVGA